MPAKTTKKTETKTKTDVLRIDEPKLARLLLRLHGISPLVCHNFGAKAKAELAERQQGKGRTRTREPKNPQAEYEAAFYRDEKGAPCFPASGVKLAVLTAAKTAKNAGATLAGTTVRQAMFVEGHLLPILDPKGKKAATPRMVEDPVRVGGKGKGTGGADLRYRPYFDNWSMNLSILYNAAYIKVEEIVNLLKLAGFGVGLGEWRPEKDGSMGMFAPDIKSLKVVNYADA